LNDTLDNVDDVVVHIPVAVVDDIDDNILT
jgi:hypothetical protein